MWVSLELYIYIENKSELLYTVTYVSIYSVNMKLLKQMLQDSIC